jgi:group I intron endonuclease
MKNDENRTGVYTLTDIVSGKFYVGSSQDAEMRVRRHFRELRLKSHRNDLLQKLWDSGAKIVPVYYPTETREDAYELEQDFLDRYKDSDLLLNICLTAKGGDNLTRHPNRDEIIEKIYVGLMNRMRLMTSLEKKQLFGKPGSSNPMWGKTHSDEVKKRISDAHKGITRRSGYNLSDDHRRLISELAKARTGEKNGFYGKKHSDESKKRMSESMKLLKLVPTNVRKVIIDGVEHESVSAAARALKVSPALIIYRLCSQKERYAGYFYKEEGSTTSP